LFSKGIAAEGMAKDYTDNLVLLEGLKKKDIRAFEFLYRNSRNRLYVLAFSFLGDAETAKDLLQDFFFDFWHNHLAAKIDTSLNAYLFNAVRNRSLNYLNKEQTAERLKQTMLVAREIPTNFPLENLELKRQIDEAIDKLPMMAGRVFRMQYQENLSQLEIAQRLNISRHTVSNHIDRALRELRQKLRNV
jgi:RNA polymerase sigma-70 factor (family 1)